MNTKTKHIEVVPYNPEWPRLFEIEAALIKKALGDICTDVHHVGSTAVPGLTAKPKIDIIAVVSNGPDCIEPLERAGFTYCGEWNIPGKYGFTKRKTSHEKQENSVPQKTVNNTLNSIIDINLHVFEKGHTEIERNLLFRDYLRSHPQACTEYSVLKQQLLQNASSFEKHHGDMFVGYTLGKHEFIQNIGAKAGFNGFRFLKCSHSTEWEAFHRIRKEQLFDPINVIYDKNHPTITAADHFSFVLYKGNQIVSVAFVQFLNETEAALRSLATDEPYKNKGYAKKLMHHLEHWIKRQGKTVIKMHAALGAEQFYRKLGYVDMEFDDPSITPKYVDLGKIL